MAPICALINGDLCFEILRRKKRYVDRFNSKLTTDTTTRGWGLLEGERKGKTEVLKDLVEFFFQNHFFIAK